MTPSANGSGGNRQRKKAATISEEVKRKIVDEYLAGETSVNLGVRYAVTPTAVLDLVRAGGHRVRRPGAQPLVSAKKVGRTEGVDADGSSPKDGAGGGKRRRLEPSDVIISKALIELKSGVPADVLRTRYGMKAGQFHTLMRAALERDLAERRGW